jgi:hypothetical protein
VQPHVPVVEQHGVPLTHAAHVGALQLPESPVATADPESSPPVGPSSVAGLSSPEPPPESESSAGVGL